VALNEFISEWSVITHEHGLNTGKHLSPLLSHIYSETHLYSSENVNGFMIGIAGKLKRYSLHYWWKQEKTSQKDSGTGDKDIKNKVVDSHKLISSSQG
jgi:hypothetical protein